MVDLVTLDPVADLDRITDLFARAGDYIQLESGKSPNPDFVHDTLTGIPDGADIFLRGFERPDKTLAGFASNLRHYPEHGHWYMGLLLLDPAERGRGLGRIAAQNIIDAARADGAPCIRIAVLDQNHKGRAFWDRMGYRPERSVQGDDHLRHVLIQQLN